MQREDDTTANQSDDKLVSAIEKFLEALFDYLWRTIRTFFLMLVKPSQAETVIAKDQRKYMPPFGYFVTGYLLASLSAQIFTQDNNDISVVKTQFVQVARSPVDIVVLTIPVLAVLVVC